MTGDYQKLEVRLWQRLTGGRVHVSIRCDGAVHVATVCGYGLESYVSYDKLGPWWMLTTCKECCNRLRFVFLGVRSPVQDGETFGDLFDWAQESQQGANYVVKAKKAGT